MLRQWLLFALLAFVVFSAAFLPIQKDRQYYHSEAERAFFAQMAAVPPPVVVDSTQLFPAASDCSGCHGHDPNGYALLDLDGNDVNIFDDWRATMMANSAKDPFWRAKVSHEVLVNPAHADELQTVCTSCHAPMGHYTAILRGADHYTIDDLLVDTIGLDGVSCGACHQISAEQLGDLHSGQINFDTNRVVYGPYDLPFAAPMIQYVGFEPLQSDHIGDAGLCASCHSLLTGTVDLAGQPTGQTFVEQATYHEWLNSDYGEDGNNVTCQNCHIPQIKDPVVISANYLFLEGRSPYGLHEMVGGNTFMLQLMKENREALGIDAEEEQFDETIAKTFQMLQEKSIELNLDFLEVNNDTAAFAVTLYNLAGHKFPSGYPSRRAFVEFVVVAEGGDTLFHSGKLRSDYEVEGQDPEYEPHYTTIRAEEEVQIYEMVMADVTGAVTTVLERAATKIKDNRLPPLGFRKDHPVYDTTTIDGLALLDPDFNQTDGMEGSGSDRTFYQVALGGYTGLVQVYAAVHYQSLPPKWMAPMFAENTPEIVTFKQMYDAADQSPVLVSSGQIDDLFVEGGVATKEALAGKIKLYPNPAGNGLVYLETSGDLLVEGVKVWDAAGRLVASWNGARASLEVPGSGIFLVEVQTDRGVVRKRLVKF